MTTPFIIDKTMVVPKGQKFTLPLFHDRKPGIPSHVNVYYTVLDGSVVAHSGGAYLAVKEGQTTVRVKLTDDNFNYIADCAITIIVVASLTPEGDTYEIMPEPA